MDKDKTGQASKQLIAEAEKIITPSLLRQLKADIGNLGHNTGPSHEHDWQQLVPHVKGCYLGDLDDHRVFAVDADKVMLFYYADFVVAGNPEIYSWIPRGQFWVDHCFVDKTTSDFRHDLLHESVEARMLKAWGKDSYADRAHPAANYFELAYMRELGLDKDETAKKDKPKGMAFNLPWEPPAVPRKAQLKP